MFPLVVDRSKPNQSASIHRQIIFSPKPCLPIITIITRRTKKKPSQQMLLHLLIHRDSSCSTVILRQTLLLLRLLCNTNNSSVVFQHTIITTISILHLIIMQHYPQAQFTNSSMACTIIIVLLLLLLSPITIVLLLRKTEETVYHHFVMPNPMQHQGSHRPVASLITITIHLVSTLIRPRQFVITTKEIVNCTTKRSYLLQTLLQTALARVRTLVHLHRYHQFLLRETRPQLLLLWQFHPTIVTSRQVQQSISKVLTWVKLQPWVLEVAHPSLRQHPPLLLPLVWRRQTILVLCLQDQPSCVSLRPKARPLKLGREREAMVGLSRQWHPNGDLSRSKRKPIGKGLPRMRRLDSPRRRRLCARHTMVQCLGSYGRRRIHW